jgi:hypothetical protein
MKHNQENAQARRGLLYYPMGVVLLCAMVTWLFLYTDGLTAGEEQGPLLFPPSAHSVQRDLEIALRAQREIQKDKPLHIMNVQVTVRDSVATLHGMVRSSEDSRRAVKIVQEVSGISRVLTSRLTISPTASEEPPLALPLEPDPPMQSESGAPPAAPNPQVPRTPPAPPDRPANPLSPGPVVKPGPAKLTGNTRPSITLQPPVGLGKPAGSLTANPAQAGKPGDAAAMVERIRKEDARFRDIEMGFQAGVVRLRGAEDNGENIMALAQALSRVPGVERVIILGANRSY